MLKSWRKQVADRIDNQSEAARVLTERLGRNVDRAAVNKMLKGTRSIQADEAVLLAEISGIPLPYQSSPELLEVDHPNLEATLMIQGVVEAGAWRDITEASFPAREVAAMPDPKFPRARQFLLEVRGDSMNAARPMPIVEGCLLRCVDFYDSGLELRTGQIAVVERRRDGGHLIETTVKRVHRYEDRIELVPESTNPAHKPLLWNQHTEDDATETRLLAIVTQIISEIAV